MCELQQLLYYSKYDILLVTETWLHSGVNSALLDPSSAYHILRKDRPDNCHGGGVAVIVKRSFCVVAVTLDSVYASLELLCFDLILGKCKLRFFVTYRPPYSDQLALDYIELLIRCLTQYTATEPNATNIIVGDFNCPKIDWPKLSCPNHDHISKCILEWAIAGGFCQLVNFPTRCGNTLDLVLVDDEQIVSCIDASPPLGHSDHCIVDFKLVLSGSNSYAPETDVPVVSKYKWFKADFDAIAECLYSTDWNALICHNPSALSSWSAFLHVLWSAINSFVPKSQCIKRGSRKNYSREVRRLMIKKRHLWKKCKLNPQMRWQYRDCADELRSKCRDAVKEEEEHIIRSNNLGLFYRHINSRIQYRAPIGALIDSTGAVVTSDKIKANMFNNYYASVGVKDDGKIPSCTYNTVTDILETVSFTESSIIFAINKLKPNLSSGPDNLPPLLFKQLKHCLAGPLSLLFTQLLSVGVVPEDWTKALIIPVFKKGTAGDVGNYRPISLTCVACKLMERIIAKHIYDHLVNCSLLAAAQHGFVRSRSTCTNLLESINDWTLVIQNRSAVTIAYIDFTRAFDSVSHEKLFARLYMYGIRGNVLQWLQNFFKNRTHQTRVGECLSDVCNLLSGVVQGSGIGPIMFIAYINELAQLLEHYIMALL